MLLSLSTLSPDDSVLGVRTATASTAATVSITGKVLENISGTALVSNNFIHVGRMKVQPSGTNVAFTVIYSGRGLAILTARLPRSPQRPKCACAARSRSTPTDAR